MKYADNVMMDSSWILEQEKLKSQVICYDMYNWQHKRCISRVGGIDLSFIKGDESVACAALVICELPNCEVVYEDITLVPLTVPYVPGFLGFREAPAIVEAFSRLCDTHTNLVPECILVDGNGILHPRGFGLASHVGELKCCIANGECRCFCLCIVLTTELQTGSSCEIGSFNSDVTKYSSLLGCDAVMLGCYVTYLR